MIDLLLCFTAITLGLRHGLDFDHLMAIADLVCSTRTSSLVSDSSLLQSEKIASYRLAVFYCLGHAAVVSVFGLAALSFRSMLPVWVDDVMERIVGLTLIGLGAWMLASSFRGNHGQQTMPRSRGSYVLTAISAILSKAGAGISSKHIHKSANDSAILSDWKCALSIGAIHGIGAETGTQVILLSALPGSVCFSSGLLMLACFILGMLISTIGLAFLFSEGCYFVVMKRRSQIIVSIAVSLISIITGCLFLFGRSDLLPQMGSICK